MTTQRDALRADGVDGEHRHQGRVDPARERQADVAEAVLLDVVAQAEDERLVDLVEVGERLGERPGRRPRGPRRPAAPPRTGRRGRAPPRRATTSRLWPSKTSSSWPPTRLQKAKQAPYSRARSANICFALAPLAAVVGRARRVGDQLGALRRPRSAPAGPATQQSSQIVSPTAWSADVDRRAARCRGRSSAARRRRRSWAAGSCGRRPARRRRRARRASCGRGGSRRRRSTGSAKPTRAVMPSTPPAQLLDRAPVGGDEVGLQVEVLGRVAGDAELGEDHQLGALRAGAADPLGDLRRVGVDRRRRSG